MSPPAQRPPVDKHRVAQASDSFTEAREKASDDSLRKTLQAMAALALTVAPQAAHAGASAQPEVARMGQQVKAKVEALKDTAESIKENLDPNGYLDEYESQVGDYTLRVKPLDLSLRPRIKSGMPVLKLKGEILETSLAKTVELGQGWSMRQGFTAKLEGEATTYDGPRIDLQAGVFREYKGPVGDDFQAEIQTDFGVRHRFLGEDEGLRVGLGFRQELEGGNYEFMGHDYQLYMEAREGIYHNLDSGKTEVSYRVMAGPKKDFDLELFGRKGKLTVTVGPEIKGNSQGDAFDLGVKTKARLRF